MVGAEFGDDLSGGDAGSVCLVGREADGADAGMAAAAIALADLGQVDHGGGVGFGPGIGADGDFGAEAGLGQADGVGGVGVEVVRDELVEAFEGMVGDVEEDGTGALLTAGADELEGLLVALKQRRQQGGDEGLAEDFSKGHLGEQGDEAGDKFGILRGLDDEGELHGGGGHFDG